MSQDGVYHFVNKTSKNIKDKHHRSEVYSFVQKDGQFRKQKRLKKDLALRDAGARQLPWCHRETSLDSDHHDDTVDYENAVAELSRSTSASSWYSGTALAFHTQICPVPSKDHLDPFLRTAETITHHERNLLQYYLSVVPAAVYGNSKNAMDCVVRDTAILFVQTDNTRLQWTLLSAETFLLGSTAAEMSPTILARKTYLYRKMYEMVTDPKTRYLNTTIQALAFAAIAEARSTSLQSGQNHLIGAMHLIQGRGGVTTLPTTNYLLLPFTWLGVGAAAFADAIALEAAIASFLRLMRAMQDWHEECLQKMKWLYLAQVKKGDLYRYVEARSRAFGPLAALRPFLQAPFYDSAIRPQLRSHMAILWMLNKTLWEFRGDHILSSELLEQLDTHVTASDDTAQLLDKVVIGYPSAQEMEQLARNRKPTLKAMAVVHIFANCTKRIQWPPSQDTAPNILRWYDTASYAKKPGDEALPPLVRWFETVDAVELLQLLSPATRQIVLARLSIWLICDARNVHSTGLPSLSSGQLDLIAGEMRSAWMTAQQPKSG